MAVPTPIQFLPHLSLFILWLGVNSVTSFDFDIQNINTTHYQYINYTNPIKSLMCQKCKPGFYLKDHCTTDTGRAFCLECPSNTYMDTHTFAKSCIQCSTACRSNNLQVKVEEKTKRCTRTSDIVCECVEGYFREPGPHGVCRRWSACPTGYGVVKPGDGYNNTTCKLCPPGTYSNISSATDPCEECSKCSEGYMVSPGTCNGSIDTICLQDEPTIGKNNGNHPESHTVLIVLIVVLASILLLLVLVVLHRRGCIHLPCWGVCAASLEHDPEKDGKMNNLGAGVEQSALLPHGDENNKIVKSNGHSENGKQHTVNGHGNTVEYQAVQTVFMKLSKLLGTDFRMFFRHLGLDETTMTQVLMVNTASSAQEQIYQLFHTFYKTLPQPLDKSQLRNDLLKAVSNFAQNDKILISKFKENLESFESSS